MPIYFDKTKDAFILKYPTEDEQEALIRLGIDYITKVFGNSAAATIIETFRQVEQAKYNEIVSDTESETMELNKEKDDKETFH